MRKKEGVIRKPIGANTEFIAVNVIIGVVFLISIVLSVLDKTLWKINWCDSNIIGIACQVVTSATFLVGSIIGIAISLQKDEIFGISFTEFNRLRGRYKYSVKTIIIFIFLTSVCNALCFVFDIIFACCGLSLASVIFCVYVTSQEVPLMMREDKTLLKIIKDQIYNNLIRETNFPTEAITAIGKLMCYKEDSLKNTYYQLKGEDEDLNKRILLALLDIQEQQAFELSKIENKEKQRSIASAIYSNLENILCFRFDLTKELKEEAKDNVYHLTRALFRLSELPEFVEKTTGLVADTVSLIDYLDTEEKKEFILAVALPMISVSVTSKNFCFAKAMRKKFSELKYILNENKSLTVLFSVMSLHFYYLCNDAHDVTDELKNEVKKFIEFGGVDGNTIIEPWKNLLYGQIEDIQFDLKDLLYYFDLNKFNWDVNVNNSDAHFVVLTKSYIMQWYLTCLFHSFSVWDFDFTTLLVDDKRIRYDLKEIGNKILSNEDGLCLTETMSKMAEFYGFDKAVVELYLANKAASSTFFDFINTLEVEDLNEKRKRATSVDMGSFIQKCKDKIKKSIESEWGYDPKINIESEPKYTNVLLEKFFDAVNYEEAISSSILRSICNEILNNLPVTIFKRDNHFDENIEQIIGSEGKLNISGAAYSCGHFLTSEGLREKFNASIKNAHKITSKIFNGRFFIKDGAFSFNCEIIKMQAIELTPDQISEQAERYKRADGQYIYDGALISREVLVDTIRSLWYILSVEIRYQINASRDSIFRIDLFPDNKANKSEPSGDEGNGEDDTKDGNKKQ